jgi:hypothetical protein
MTCLRKDAIDRVIGEPSIDFCGNGQKHLPSRNIIGSFN